LTKSFGNGKYFKYLNIGNIVLNIILFADNQAIFSESEDGLQRALNGPENIANGFKLRISTIRSKIVIDNKIMEQV
jgi:hypothetical protein